MFSYVVRRLVYMVPMLFVISIICFLVLQAPSGSYLSNYVHNLEQQGTRVTDEMVAQLEKRYGLNDPLHLQYFKWISGIITRGDFGQSFIYRRPVSELIAERLPWTILIAGSTLIFTWILGIPIGIYSAVNKYSPGDHLFTVFGFFGISIPNFFLALMLLFLMAFVVQTGSVGGLFSPEFAAAPWSVAKFVDLLKHIWMPIVAVGTAGLAGVIRKMRGNLLDVLNQQYVQTARSKGLRENIVVYKHAVRNALHPLIMSLGMSLPQLISGAIIVGIVLNLPTTGVIFYRAIRGQDTYLAGSFLMMMALLLMVGNLLADIALALVDPRIRYD